MLLVSGLTLANVAQTTTKKIFFYVYINASLTHLVPVHFATTGDVKSSWPESLNSSNIQTQRGTRTEPGSLTCNNPLRDSRKHPRTRRTRKKGGNPHKTFIPPPLRSEFRLKCLPERPLAMTIRVGTHKFGRPAHGQLDAAAAAAVEPPGGRAALLILTSINDPHYIESSPRNGVGEEEKKKQTPRFEIE